MKASPALAKEARMSHFSPATVKALAARGVRVLGPVAVPDMTSAMPYANASTAYALDDNGTHRVRTHAEVRAMARPNAGGPAPALGQNTNPLAVYPRSVR